MRKLLVVLALVLSCPALPQPVSPRPEGGIALVGGTLIDGKRGSVIRDSVVLVRGERIEAVGTVGALSVPAGYETISTEGMTVLPGLWDMHTHLQYSAHSDLTAWNARYLP